VESEITLHNVQTEEDAERLHFPGSPTIRVDGADIDENPNLPIGLACRAYRREDGRITPLPPKSLMLRAIRTAMQQPAAGYGEAAS
jgi:hypothetical protein